jgi:hypothetical protein
MPPRVTLRTGTAPSSHLPLTKILPPPNRLTARPNFHARIFRFILKGVRRSWLDVTADLVGKLASPRETPCACPASSLPKMLTAKAYISRRCRGPACSPGLATEVFAAASLDVIRVIPTQRFKGTLQRREPVCREPSAVVIIATASKLPDQIFHNLSKICHLSPLHCP